MNRKTLFALVTAAMLAACGQQQTSHAAAPQTAAADGVPAATVKTITEKLEKNYAEQDLKVEGVYATPLANLYEVVVSGKQIIYTDAEAKYMLVGDFIDIAAKKSLTDQRKEDLNRTSYADLPFEMAVKEVRGNGKLQVAVFSDPDCPYCKRLEAEFAKMTDITIYTFLMPITGLHPDAVRKSEQIWCQPDRTAAWVNWMRQGKLPPKAAACDNPVAETVSLGEQLGFTGTPTLIFPNGKVQPGYAPAAQLQKILADNQK
ncbi:MAG: DsbC family protein [Neisseria sp.]|nr:DsbC family protein [Neisseria sp.]